MSALLERAVFGPRDDATLLAEMNALTRRHREGCAPYRRMTEGFTGAGSLAELPFVHVGLFKRLALVTELDDVRPGRTLESSSTSGQGASRVRLDAASSALQAKSSRAILADFVGEARRPLLVLDSSASLRRRGGLSARIAAAMSLEPFADGMHFLLGAGADPASLHRERIVELAGEHDALLVYGFTWILWRAWAQGLGEDARRALAGKTVHFVHSGGWKKLEAEAVDRATFDAALLDGLGPDSRVIDYYGLVEQVGIVFPLCECGYRHAPVWAEVLVRDPFSSEVLEGEPGLLQLMNPLALGAPYHNVLTEDLGRLIAGDCPCGRGNRRFELIGRVPKAELRGCSNV
ncbi:MAG TPA: acyl-protein synthetase [Planctomycetes bacterium]|nr:acyl-protein synthetase [Planctomycetota bacterium]